MVEGQGIGLCGVSEQPGPHGLQHQGNGGCLARAAVTHVVQVYLRRVRALHWQEGCTPGWTAQDVRQIIKGASNCQRPAPQPSSAAVSRNRVPVTPFLLLKIKKELSKDQKLTLLQKRLFWLYCSWAYMGALRSADLLSETTSGSVGLFCSYQL